MQSFYAAHRAWTSIVSNFSEGETTEETPDKEAEIDQGVQEMTLDEYRAMQSTNTASKPSFNIRKAGEGVDDKQWKKTYMYKKKALEEDEDEEEYEVSHGASCFQNECGILD